MSDTNTWAMIDAERSECCDFLESLSPQQWDTQTLCDGWKVKHVAAHMSEASTITFGAGFMLLLKNGFNFDKAMLRAAQHDGDLRTQAEIVDTFRAHAKDRTTPPMTKPMVMLCDLVVHQQDCRRPLGLPRQVPEDRLRAVLADAVKTQPIVGNKKRVAGVKLIATDIDWTYGEGAEVRGPAEALMMATYGRKAALDDLSGDGVAILRSR